MSSGPRFSELASHLAGSDIIRLTWEINARKDRGEQILNMTIGDFNPAFFPVPEALKGYVNQSYNEGQTNYPQPGGLPDLQKAICDFLYRRGGFSFSSEEIQIASGARPLVYAIFKTVLDPGDTVIYGVPSWNNEHFTYLTSAKGVKINSGPENHFLPTIETIRPHLPNASLIALCSPLNPSGTVFRVDALREICEAILLENQGREKAGRKPVYLMFDQIYWRLTFGKLQHVHPIGLLPEMKPYTIYVDGISKAFCATGLRLGWAMGPSDVIDKMKHLLGHVGAWAGKPEQWAVARFLNDAESEEQYHSWVTNEVYQRLTKIYHGISSMTQKGLFVSAIEPEAALYLSVKFNLIGKSFQGSRIETTDDISAFLLNQAGLAVVPFRSFGVEGYPDWFRLSVGTCSLDELDMMLSRLELALASIKN